MIDLLELCVRRARAFAYAALAAAVLAVAMYLFWPPTYTSRVRFVPEAQRLTPQLSGALLGGLAAQLGFNFGTPPTESPAFYADVLKSKYITYAVLESRFAVPGSPTDSALLLDILHIKGDSLVRLDRGARRLDGLVQTNVKNQTGIITLEVSGPDPRLAADMAKRYVALLNDFNLNYRQTNARQQFDFIQGRVTAAKADLDSAEAALRTFLERNQLYQSSPALVFQHDRLQREVELRQQLYVTLSQELERARIEALNDTPAITVVDPAMPPQRRTFPRLLPTFAVLLMLAFAGTFTWALGAEYVTRSAVGERETFRRWGEGWRRLRRRRAQP